MRLETRNRNDSGTEQPTSSDYWMEQSRQFMSSQLSKRLRTRPAKNVIMFLGDGMGVTVNTAARIYVGQVDKKYSDQAPLAWELFDHSGLARVSAEIEVVSIRHSTSIDTRRTVPPRPTPT